ncbi:MAG: hypothetical protein Fur0015_07800 [Ignavibacteriales bacterium]
MKSSQGKTIAGAILIFVGLLWLTDNLVLFPFQMHNLIFSFPVILFVVGIIILANSKNNLLGYIFIVIGGYNILDDYFHIPLKGIAKDFWPVLLIIFGVYILLKSKERDSKISNPGNDKFNLDEFEKKNSANYAQDSIDDFVIFGGSEKRIFSNNFRGGKITTLFGGTDIDLRQATLADETVTMEVVTIFGGIDLYVPKDWKVLLNVTPIFGAFDDERILNPNNDFDGRKTLVIKGVVIFGGGDLKN